MTTPDISYKKVAFLKTIKTTDTFFVSFDSKTSKDVTKCYLSFSSIEEFDKFYQSLTEDEKNCYELLMDDKPRNEYYDLDFNFKDHPKIPQV